jgi:polysaccharide biosynthesis protein PslH
MRILVCASAAPLPPATGFTLVLEALLGQFRQRHEVRVIAYRLPSQSGAPPPDVRLVPAGSTGLRELAAGVFRGRPRYAGPLAGGMRAAVQEELERFGPDVVHVTGGRLAELGRDLGRYPSVIVPLDAAHLGIQTRHRASRGIKGLLLQVEEKRVRRFEATEYGRFDRVIVVSEQDRGALEGLNPRLRVAVIPNGVDADFYAPNPSVTPDARRIVFTGVMSSPGNIVAAEFVAERVFPLVQAVRPDARLALVGRAPPPRVRALATPNAVDVTGEVPDVRPWLTGSRVFVCPMVSGTGIKNKLLEAMAAGLPCVATPLALGGLAVQPGRELLVGDTPQSLAALLLQVLEDDGLAARLGHAARAYIRDHHSWAAVAQAYERVYAEARAERRHSPGGSVEPA